MNGSENLQISRQTWDAWNAHDPAGSEEPTRKSIYVRWMSHTPATGCGTRLVGLALILFSVLINLGLGLGEAFASDISFPNPSLTGIMNPDAWTENRNTNPLGFGPGYLIIVSVDFVTPTGPGITGMATQGATTLPLANTGTSPFGSFFSGALPFSPALTGPWTVTLTDASGPVSAPTNAIPNPEIIPFVSNILVSGPGLAPHVAWTLPDLTGLFVQAESFRVYDVATKIDLMEFALASPAVDSFDVPIGLLQAGKSYSFDILLSNFARSTPTSTPFLQNRSETFSASFTTPVPEPTSLLLVGSTLTVLTGVAWRQLRRK